MFHRHILTTTFGGTCVYKEDITYPHITYPVPSPFTEDFMEYMCNKTVLSFVQFPSLLYLHFHLEWMCADKCGLTVVLVLELAL